MSRSRTRCSRPFRLKIRTSSRLATTIQVVSMELLLNRCTSASSFKSMALKRLGGSDLHQAIRFWHVGGGAFRIEGRQMLLRLVVKV
jgi:hypothetical protein